MKAIPLVLLLVLGIQFLKVESMNVKRTAEPEVPEGEGEQDEGEGDEDDEEGDEDDGEGDEEGDEGDESEEDEESEEEEMTSAEEAAAAMANRLKTSKLKVLSAGDTNNDEVLSYEELVNLFKSTSFAKFADRDAKEVFDVYDKNGDRRITPDEVEGSHGHK